MTYVDDIFIVAEEEVKQAVETSPEPLGRLQPQSM